MDIVLEARCTSRVRHTGKHAPGAAVMLGLQRSRVVSRTGTQKVSVVQKDVYVNSHHQPAHLLFS